jgi:hypothetical protein
MVTTLVSAWHTDEDDLLFLDFVVVVEQIQPSAMQGERPERRAIGVNGQVN